MTSPETPAAPETPPPSAASLALHVFDDPAGTFTKLAARPTAWLPIVLIVLVSAFAQFMMPVQLQRQQAERMMQRIEQRTGNPIPQATRDAQLAKIASPVRRVTGAVSAIIMALVILVIIAAVCKLIFGAGAPEPIKFRQEFAVVAHANIVWLLGMVVTTFMIRATGRLDAGVSLGFLAPSGFAHAYLTLVSVWAVWFVVLLAIGNKILARSKSLTGPLVILGALWLVLNIPFAFLMKFAMGL